MHMLEYVSGCTPRPVTATTKTVSHVYYTSSLVIASGLGAHPLTELPLLLLPTLNKIHLDPIYPSTFQHMLNLLILNK